MMRLYSPGPPLAAFIECLWFQDGSGQPIEERAFPTGTVELVINLSEDALAVRGQEDTATVRCFDGSMVCGPHTEYFVIHSNPHESTMGVHFRPGGAGPFLGLPCEELHNRHIPLEAVWQSQAVALREELLEAQSVDERFGRLESFLRQRALRPLHVDPRITHTLSLFDGGTWSGGLADLSRDLGLSHRRFIELFKTAVGLTPQQYLRVQRFQRVLQSLAAHATGTLAEAAHDCGYYDQSHFNREFRAFSGMSPGAYVDNRPDRPNHVPLLD